MDSIIAIKLNKKVNGREKAITGVELTREMNEIATLMADKGYTVTSVLTNNTKGIFTI